MVRERIVIALSLIIIALVVAVLVKYEVITGQILSEKRVLIGVVKDLITIIAIVFGAILTYFKFFAGQTFTPKADIDFQVSIIERPDSKLMHTLKVTITNKGTLTIWDPVARIKIDKWCDRGQNEEVVKQFMEDQYFEKHQNDQSIIDPGESVHFFIWRVFDSNIWAITYRAEVSSSSGRSWQNFITIPNKTSTKVNMV